LNSINTFSTIKPSSNVNPFLENKSYRRANLYFKRCHFFSLSMLFLLLGKFELFYWFKTRIRTCSIRHSTYCINTLWHLQDNMTESSLKHIIKYFYFSVFRMIYSSTFKNLAIWLLPTSTNKIVSILHFATCLIGSKF
jgi:hypothetical protein